MIRCKFSEKEYLMQENSNKHLLYNGYHTSNNIVTQRYLLNNIEWHFDCNSITATALYYRQHYALATLHGFPYTFVEPLVRLRRLQHQSRYVLLAYDDAAVLQRKGTVAGAYGSAARRRWQYAAELPVYLQFQWIGAGWEIITGMFQCGANSATVYYEHAVYAIGRVAVAFDFYQHILSFEFWIRSFELVACGDFEFLSFWIFNFD